MLSDEEKKELQELINLLYNGHISQYGKRKLEAYIKKQQTEIEEYKKQLDLDNECEIALNSKIMDLEKEIEELKEENEKYKNPPFFDEDDYVSKVESEQKERKAWIKGTNDAYELCNKKWEDKTKAIIEELENYYREIFKQDNSPNEFLIGQDCLSKLSILQEVKQSLLEKE